MENMRKIIIINSFPGFFEGLFFAQTVRSERSKKCPIFPHLFPQFNDYYIPLKAASRFAGFEFRITKSANSKNPALPRRLQAAHYFAVSPFHFSQANFPSGKRREYKMAHTNFLPFE